MKVSILAGYRRKSIQIDKRLKYNLKTLKQLRETLQYYGIDKELCRWIQIYTKQKYKLTNGIKSNYQIIRQQQQDQLQQ